jgi:hypothetical protein
VGGRRDGVRDLLGLVIDRVHLLGIGSGLETKVLGQLVSSPRTMRELVNQIYHTDRGNPEFESSYARMRRSVKRLEAKGYVSSSLFGHEKTYRVTRYGERCILGLIAGFPPPRAIGHLDIAIFSSTILIGVLLLADLGAMPDTVGRAASILFLVLLGVSLCRVVTVLREVR